MKFFQQLLLTRFVIFLDLGKCIHVLTLFYIIYIICVFHLRKRAFPLFLMGRGNAEAFHRLFPRHYSCVPFRH